VDKVIQNAVTVYGEVLKDNGQKLEDSSVHSVEEPTEISV